MEFNDLLPVLRLATEAHDGQLDKGGEPYIYHCIRVGAALLPNIEAAAAGLLHDVFEDTLYTLEQVGHLNLPSHVVTALDHLTRTPSMPYADYIERVAVNRLARLVKLLDIRDNLDPRRLERAAARGHDIDALLFRYQTAVDRLMDVQRVDSRLQAFDALEKIHDDLKLDSARERAKLRIEAIEYIDNLDR